MGMVIDGAIRSLVLVLQRVSPRICLEYEGLDRHGHGVRRIPDPTQVHIVEIPQRDAVDREDLRFQRELVLQKRAQRLRDVAVEDQIDRLRLLDCSGKGAHDAIGERGQPLIGRKAAPAKRHRDLGLAFDDIEASEVLDDAPRNLRSIDRAAQVDVRLQHL